MGLEDGTMRKLKKIETLINKDLANGKHIQKKFREMVKKNGQCPNELCEEVRSLKIVAIK